MANKPEDWTKELEAELATPASNMWGRNKARRKRLHGRWRQQIAYWSLVDGEQSLQEPHH
jgi:hypothetical protein